MQTILIFTKNWLGDVIFEEPFIRLIKEQIPDSNIICVTNYRTSEILAANPNVSEIIVFDDRSVDKSFISRFKLIIKLRRKKIDKAFLLHRSFSRAVMLFLSGIPERYGYESKGRSFFLSSKVCGSPLKMHRVDYLLNLLKENSIVDNVPRLNYRFYYREADKVKANILLEKANINKDKFICINPGANWDQKRWAIERFALLAEAVLKKYNVSIIITGAIKDEELASQIIAMVNSNRVISFCGKTNIGEVAALFYYSKLLISADSGPLHIAGGVGTNVIAVFGPTDLIETGPRGEGKQFVLQKLPIECTTPCFNEKCPSNVCMLNVTVEDVLAVIRSNELLF